MSLSIPERLLRQEVTIRAFKGSGAYGDVFEAAVTVRCRVDTTRLVVRSNTGAEVVAEAAILLPASVRCPVKSKVKLPGETVERTTLTYTPKMAGGLSPHHVEVTTA